MHMISSPSLKLRRYFPSWMLLCCFWIATAIAGAETEPWSPWVTSTTTRSAIIHWRADTDGVCTIDYATVKYYNRFQRFQKRKTVRSTDTYQHVGLNGLVPNTPYVYSVRPSSHGEAFSNRTFRTMPLSGSFTFVVISDSQEGHTYPESKRFKYVADAIAKEDDILFVLHGGDYAGHDSESLWGKFFAVADPMLAKTAIFTTIGNHEYHNGTGDYPPTTAVQYQSSFETPLNYSFDCCGVRFIVLNSPDPTNTDSDDPHTSFALAQSQADWLSRQLDPRRGKIWGAFTIHHHPIWDYGRTTIDTNLQPWEVLYHACGISANFAGHTHNYQRYSVEGIPYFIVGNAGGRCADINDGDPHAQWYQFGETRKLGYLKVTVDSGYNTATAQEVFVASVKEDDSDETPHVYNPPIIADTVTFPLRDRRHRFR